MSRRAPAWKPGTRDAIKASLENHVFPTLGGKSVAEVRPGDIRTVVTAIEAGGAAETAGRVFQRIRSTFRYAIAHEIATLDPTYPLKAAEIFKPRRVSHRASLAERDVPAFPHALDGYAGSQATKSALELLILTAVRPGKHRGAAWVEFEPERGLWRIPAERMKMGSEHLVPLSRQALQVLETLRSVALSGELFFPSPFYPRKPIGDGTFIRHAHEDHTPSSAVATLLSATLSLRDDEILNTSQASTG